MTARHGGCVIGGNEKASVLRGRCNMYYSSPPDLVPEKRSCIYLPYVPLAAEKIRLFPGETSLENKIHGFTALVRRE